MTDDTLQIRLATEVRSASIGLPELLRTESDALNALHQQRRAVFDADAAVEARRVSLDRALAMYARALTHDLGHAGARERRLHTRLLVLDARAETRRAAAASVAARSNELAAWDHLRLVRHDVDRVTRGNRFATGGLRQEAIMPPAAFLFENVYDFHFLDEDRRSPSKAASAGREAGERWRLEEPLKPWIETTWTVMWNAWGPSATNEVFAIENDVATQRVWLLAALHPTSDAVRVMKKASSQKQWRNSLAALARSLHQLGAGVAQRRDFGVD